MMTTDPSDPCCAQLRDGDVLEEVNGKNVHHYSYNELVTLLEQCPKGCVAIFVVLRHPDKVTCNYLHVCIQNVCQ